MKYIALPTLLAVVGLAASSFFATPAVAAAPSNLSHTDAELINLETLKNVDLFGTPAQKQIAVQMFDRISKVSATVRLDPFTKITPRSPRRLISSRRCHPTHSR